MPLSDIPFTTLTTSYQKNFKNEHKNLQIWTNEADTLVKTVANWDPVFVCCSEAQMRGTADMAALQTGLE